MSGAKAEDQTQAYILFPIHYLRTRTDFEVIQQEVPASQNCHGVLEEDTHLW
jgi:hypothetical protein